MRLALLIVGAFVGSLVALAFLAWFVFFWLLASKLGVDGASQR